jgi:hypothetical protein
MAGLLGIAPEELALIGGLLSGKKGENWGMHFAQLAAAQDAKKRREQQEMLLKQQMEQGQLGMQLEQAQRQQGIQDQLRQAAGQAFAPPQEAHGPMESGQGAPMLPGGGGIPQFVQRAMQIDPMEGMKWQQSLAKQRNIKDVAPGASLYDVDNNKTLFTAPDKPKDWQDPAYQEFQLRRAREGASNTVVRLPQPEKAILKVDEERLGELSTAASSARRFAQTSSIINRLLEGKGGGTMIKVGTETARALGLKGDTIAANDLAESLNTRLATEVRAPGSGSTSNIEFEAYRAAVPSLKNSEEGRRLMTQVAVKFAERNAKLADYGRSLIRAGKFSDEAIAQYDEKLGSVLGDDLKRQFSSVAAPAAAGGLTPAEQRELQELRAKVSRR